MRMRRPETFGKRTMSKKSTDKQRTQVGLELEAALLELAQFLRGEIDSEHYEVDDQAFRSRPSNSLVG